MPVGIDLGTSFAALARTDARGAPVRNGGPGGPWAPRTPAVITLWENAAIVGRARLGEESGDGVVVAREAKSMLGNRAATVVDASGRRWTGEGLCALVLRKLLHGADVTEDGEAAVLSLPSRFTNGQRRAARSVAELAGIGSCRIVEDAVACAALGPPGEDLRDEIVLVCDAGRAGFAATLLAAAPSGLYVVATEFTALAGTRWMDDAIARVFERQFEAVHGRAARAEGAAWLGVSERLRHGLSRPGADVVTMTALVAGRTFDVMLSVTQFEQLLRPSLDGAESAIERCFAGAAIPRSAVERVMLVGGGAHTAPLRRRVALATGRRAEVLPGIDPQHVVAMGAASLAARLTADAGTSRPSIRHGAPLDLSYRVLDGTPDRPNPELLIRKSTPLPARRSRTFQPAGANEPRIVVEVVQSNGPDEPGIGAGVLTFGPGQGVRPGCPIDVWLGYDEHGLIVAGTGDGGPANPISPMPEVGPRPDEVLASQAEYLRQVRVE